MVASDGGVPALIDTTVVYFNITRNLAAPEFIPTVYTATVSEDRAVGNPFTVVTARDADVTVSANTWLYCFDQVPAWKVLVASVARCTYFKISSHRCLTQFNCDL